MNHPALAVALCDAFQDFVALQALHNALTGHTLSLKRSSHAAVTRSNIQEILDNFQQESHKLKLRDISAEDFVQVPLLYSI